MSPEERHVFSASDLNPQLKVDSKGDVSERG